MSTNRYIRYVELSSRLIRDSRIPLYSSKYSKKTYTQHQLLVLLLLKEYLAEDYRDTVELLKLWIPSNRRFNSRKYLILRRYRNSVTESSQSSSTGYSIGSWNYSTIGVNGFRVPPSNHLGLPAPMPATITHGEQERQENGSWKPPSQSILRRCRNSAEVCRLLAQRA